MADTKYSYTNTNIDKIDAPYNIIIGQRSGGKALRAYRMMIETYIETGKPSIYIRRGKPPVYVSSMDDLIKLKGKYPGEAETNGSH